MRFLINAMRHIGGAKPEAKRVPARKPYDEFASLRTVASPPLAPSSFGFLEMAAERFDR
jgi:hypothetical protein